MAKRISPALSNKTWQAGLHLVPEFDLLVDEAWCQVRIDYNTFTHNLGEQPSNMRVKAFYSLDGGITYPHAFQFTDVSIEDGEVRLDEDGNPLLENLMIFKLREPSNLSRKMKLEFEIDRAVKTGIEVDLDSEPF